MIQLIITRFNFIPPLQKKLKCNYVYLNIGSAYFGTFTYYRKMQSYINPEFIRKSLPAIFSQADLKQSDFDSQIDAFCEVIEDPGSIHFFSYIPGKFMICFTTQGSYMYVDSRLAVQKFRCCLLNSGLTMFQRSLLSDYLGKEWGHIDAANFIYAIWEERFRNGSVSNLDQARDNRLEKELEELKAQYDCGLRLKQDHIDRLEKELEELKVQYEHGLRLKQDHIDRLTSAIKKIENISCDLWK